MTNPWVALPTGPPYIAPADVPFINGPAFKRLKEWYNFDLFPDPYVGNFDTANVLFLSNNPRVSESDHKNLESNVFKSESLKSLVHAQDATFFYWRDDLRELDGHAYWQKLLGRNTAAVEHISRDQLLKNMAQIELIGCHSPTYKHASKLILPSQMYSFELVRDAMRLHKIIVVMRGVRFWFEYIPELKDYDHTILLSNTQNATITKGNIEKANAAGAYEKLVSALKS